MGWKNVKEHYRISHIVTARGGVIRIGSPYAYNIIEIYPDGQIISSYADRDADLTQYMDEFRADPAKLRRLISEPDTFQASIPVYFYDAGKVTEHYCEALGWPNVTHDGLLMYESPRVYSASREEAEQRAEELLQKRIDDVGLQVAEKERELSDLKQKLLDLKERTSSPIIFLSRTTQLRTEKVE